MKKILIGMLLCMLPFMSLAWDNTTLSATCDAQKITGNWDSFRFSCNGDNSVNVNLFINDGSTTTGNAVITTNYVYNIGHVVITNVIYTVTNITYTISSNNVITVTPTPISGATTAVCKVTRRFINQITTNTVSTLITYGNYSTSDGTLTVNTNQYSFVVNPTNITDGVCLVELIATNLTQRRTLAQGTLQVLNSTFEPSVYTNNMWNTNHHGGYHGSH